MYDEQFPIEQETADRLVFHDAASDYRLVLQAAAADQSLLAHFKTPEWIVTGRTLEDYRRLLPQLFPVDPNAQYLEIGPGLSDFSPSLLEEGAAHPPVAIDPGRYDRMEAMLAHALTSEHPLVAAHQALLERLLRNCRAMQDATRVRLHNVLLSTAVTAFPQLRNVADVVVDVQGAIRYVATEAPEVNRPGVTKQTVEDAVRKVEGLEHQLLKAGGVYLTTIEQ